MDPPAHPVRLGAELELAERVLQPVLENACRYAKAHVTVSIVRRGDGAVYRIADDGPGVGAAESEQIFESRPRGDAGSADGSGGVSASRWHGASHAASAET